MRLFTRVVERRSFTRAAEDLGLPRSTVTDVVKRLEGRLGVRLLERTTRHVAPMSTASKGGPNKSRPQKPSKAGGSNNKKRRGR